MTRKEKKISAGFLSSRHFNRKMFEKVLISKTVCASKYLKCQTQIEFYKYHLRTSRSELPQKSPCLCLLIVTKAELVTSTFRLQSRPSYSAVFWSNSSKISDFYLMFYLTLLSCLPDQNLGQIKL